jgi:hypothetical protein
MTENNNTQAYQQPPQPNPDLKNLDKLVGTWKVFGGAQGEVTYEWMEGGFFLIQHVDLEHDGRQIKGIEIIGHLRPFGEAPSEDIKSRFYDNMGNTLDYVYELLTSAQKSKLSASLPAFCARHWEARSLVLDAEVSRCNCPTLLSACAESSEASVRWA